MRSQLNNRLNNSVKIGHGFGADTMGPLRPPWDRMATPSQEPEENTRSTRATQEEHKRNTRDCFPIPWLAGGLRLAFPTPSSPFPLRSADSDSCGTLRPVSGSLRRH